MISKYLHEERSYLFGDVDKPIGESIIEKRISPSMPIKILYEHF